jgi:hypothetical protein
MKKTAIFLTVFVAAVTSLSMYGAPYRDLLTEGDYRREQEDSKRPAITAPDVDGVVDWQSFNQWQCFSTKQLKIECVPDEEGKDLCYPLVIVDESGDIFEFEISTGGGYINSALILSRWKSLLADEETFCTYSAYIPDTSDPHEFVFDLNQIKTSKGYWDYSAEENWREPDEGADLDPPTETDNAQESNTN